MAGCDCEARLAHRNGAPSSAQSGTDTCYVNHATPTREQPAMTCLFTIFARSARIASNDDPARSNIGSESLANRVSRVCDSESPITPRTPEMLTLELVWLA